MTRRREPEGSLGHAVREEHERRERRRREGERPLARNLALAGSLGWLIVLPALGGVLVGRWLDRRFATGIAFTAALLVIGVACGGVLAWQRIRET